MIWVGLPRMEGKPTSKLCVLCVVAFPTPDGDYEDEE